MGICASFYTMTLMQCSGVSHTSMVNWRRGLGYSLP